MVIVFDADSVLLDIMPAWFGRYNKAYAHCPDFRALAIEDHKEWALHPYTVTECGPAIYDLRTPDIYLDLPAIDGAVESVQHFLEQGDTLYVITSDQETHREIKSNRIRQLFGANTFEDIIVMDHKTQKKSTFFQQIGADVLIDDYHKNFDGLPEQALGILYRPAAFLYNRPDELPLGVIAAEGRTYREAHQQAVAIAERWRLELALTV